MYLTPHPQLHRARRVARILGRNEENWIDTTGICGCMPFIGIEEFNSAGLAMVEVTSSYEIITCASGYGVRWQTRCPGEGYRLVNDSKCGVHIFLALPQSHDMRSNVHIDFAEDDIPAVIFKDAEISVIAGRYHGLLGPVASPATRAMILDVTLKTDSEVRLQVGDDRACLIYILEGAIAVEQKLINQGSLAVLENGDMVSLVSGLMGARGLVMTALPLGRADRCL